MAKQDDFLKSKESHSGGIIMHSGLSFRCGPWAVELFLFSFFVIMYLLIIHEAAETGVFGKYTKEERTELSLGTSI